MTRSAMYSPAMEKSITFPVVPEIMRSPDQFKALGLYTPLQGLGEAALSGMRSPNQEVAADAESALEFLAGVTRFVGNTPGTVYEETLQPGEHIFMCDLSQDREAGLEVARTPAGRLSGAQPEHVVSSIIVAYSVQNPEIPVSGVDVYMEIEDDGRFDGRYARLSGSRPTDEDQWTLRTATGYVARRGLLVPDEAVSFGGLEYVGLQIGELQGRHA